MISAKSSRRRKGREVYRAFSALTQSQRDEILADPVYKRFALWIKADDWKFAKIPAKGWVTKR